MSNYRLKEVIVRGYRSTIEGYEYFPESKWQVQEKTFLGWIDRGFPLTYDEAKVVLETRVRGDELQASFEQVLKNLPKPRILTPPLPDKEPK